MLHMKRLSASVIVAGLLLSGSLMPAFAAPQNAATSAAATALEERPKICFEFAFWKYCI